MIRPRVVVKHIHPQKIQIKATIHSVDRSCMKHSVGRFRNVRQLRKMPIFVLPAKKEIEFDVGDTIV